MGDTFHLSHTGHLKVTCIIEDSGGETISRASSDGAYVIATCDGEAR